MRTKQRLVHATSMMRVLAIAGGLLVATGAWTRYSASRDSLAVPVSAVSEAAGTCDGGGSCGVAANWTCVVGIFWYFNCKPNGPPQ